MNAISNMITTTTKIAWAVEHWVLSGPRVLLESSRNATSEERCNDCCNGYEGKGYLRFSCGNFSSDRSLYHYFK